MDCKDVKNLMIERIDGNLDADSCRLVDKHLETCSSCQEEYIQIGNLLKSMLETEEKQPDQSLKQGFYSMLQNEIQDMASEEKEEKITLISRKILLTTIKYAAAIFIVFSLGYFIGNINNHRFHENTEVAALKQEIELLKENGYLISLNKPTASERLKVINTVSESNKEDQELFRALVNTLNSDENANVRMAAAYALSKFSDDEYVRISLIHSLEKQNEPIVQISLIGILIDMKDNRAKPVIEKLIGDEDVIPEVKQQAQVSLSVFV